MKIILDPGHNFLFEEYQIKGLSLIQIGRLYGVAHTTIWKWLKKHKIERRSSGPQKGKPSPIKGIKKSKEHKRKLSISMKGRIAWNKGIPRSKKTKDKIQQKLIGRYAGENNHFYGKKHDAESKIKIKVNHADVSGANNPAWLGGKSYEPYGPEFNQELKFKIRKRDDFICQICQIREEGKAHDIHHIDYNKKNNLDNNLITLCYLCHLKTNINRNQWEAYFNGTISKAA